jgi:hypothetical protein
MGRGKRKYTLLDNLYVNKSYYSNLLLKYKLIEHILPLTPLIFNYYNLIQVQDTIYPERWYL